MKIALAKMVKLSNLASLPFLCFKIARLIGSCEVSLIQLVLGSLGWLKKSSKFFMGISMSELEFAKMCVLLIPINLGKNRL